MPDRPEKYRRKPRIKGEKIMNYIIFGGSGFIGTHLIHLLKETHPVDNIYCLDIVMPGEEGVVPGGGTELCQISATLSKKAKKITCEAERIGYEIVVKALEKPIKQIAENAGVDGVVVANTCKHSRRGTGFDALHNKWCDMLSSGIMDPVRVTKSALTNAASVVALVLTSSAVITTIPENLNEK